MMYAGCVQAFLVQRHGDDAVRAARQRQVDREAEKIVRRPSRLRRHASHRDVLQILRSTLHARNAYR